MKTVEKTRPAQAATIASRDTRTITGNSVLNCAIIKSPDSEGQSNGFVHPAFTRPAVVRIFGEEAVQAQERAGRLVFV